MSKEKYKPLMPDLMEAIFDSAYLIFDLIAGILFFAFSKGNPLFILYGTLTLTLCGGDAFHLVPRIIRAVHGSNDRIRRALGRGLQISSITMTVFYIILMYVWKNTFPELTAPVAVKQEKTENWLTYDSKDMRLYVGDSNGTSAVILKNND